MLKRLFDLFASTLLLLLLAPFLLLIAVLIKVFSPGPILYKQERIGRNMQSFKILKFRSMYVQNKPCPPLTLGDRDPRITSIGWYLRKYKLDELPQLLNVIKGDMSLVGPRPEATEYLDRFSTKQREIFKVRPGITDNASIQFRNESEILAKQENPEQYYLNEIFPVKIQMGIDYANSQSLLLDLKIIFRTLAAIVLK